MNVWKKTTVRCFKNGKRCSPKATGVERVTVESKRWYGTLTLASGKRKQTPLTEDRKSSRTLLERLQRDEDRKRALGITSEDERRSAGTLDALEAYLAFLRQKGNTDEYVRTVERRLKKLVSSIRVTTIGELDSGKISRTLSEWRSKISVETSNHYVLAVKSFSRWLVRERQLPNDPLVGLSKMNADVDRRRNRRAFTVEELNRLAVVTHKSQKTFRGSDWQFTSSDRVMLYAIAANTGLRAKEIASLTVRSFDLQRKTVVVEASNTKNWKEAVLPLTETLCVELERWLPTKTGKLFPGSWITRRLAGKMLRRDLIRSGIDPVNATGKTLDFHSLRHTFITFLAKGNVHPSQAQRLARHSSITLTMDVYTHLEVEDLRSAVNVLPF